MNKTKKDGINTKKWANRKKNAHTMAKAHPDQLLYHDERNECERATETQTERKRVYVHSKHINPENATKNK